MFENATHSVTWRAPYFMLTSNSPGRVGRNIFKSGRQRGGIVSLEACPVIKASTSHRVPQSSNMHLLYTTAVILSLCADSGVLGVAVKELSASHIITIVTAPVSSPRLIKFAAANPKHRSMAPQTSLTKRVVNNGCEVGCGGNRVCTDDLSASLVPPALEDCTALRAALIQRALGQITNTFPCNSPNNPLCPSFVVSPGFERTYSLGTCLVGLVNLNPVGGPDLAFCDYLMAGIILSSYSTCITDQGFTGSVCFSNALNFNWALGVRHV
ncbi:hypothetical protein AB1N83_007181 [Pleurotus pulmonarius]